MKKIIALCTILCLSIVIILTGCSDGASSLPDIKGEMKATAYKTSITVNSSFSDTDEHHLYNGSVNVYVTISSTGEDAKEMTRKEVTIDKSTTDETDEIATSLKGKSLDFTGLTADTEYILKLYISASGSQKLLQTQSVSTINNGETEDDPIIISDLDGLLGMSKEKDAYYKLAADIDCGGSLSSIFNSSTMFSGHLDGDNHKIFNYSLASNTYSGLFGYMSGATVKNLVIEQASYNYSRSDVNLGALAGYAKNCNISNVIVTGVEFTHSAQTSSTSYIGGLVGYAVNSTIENCKLTDVSIIISKAQLKMYCGGLIGLNENSYINNCSVSGKIDATLAYNSNSNGFLYLGGFAGVNDSNLGIENSYSKVDLKVSEPNSVSSTGVETHKAVVGGFVGGNLHSTSRVTNCAAIADIEVTCAYSYTVYTGGFVGMLNDNNISRYTNCVYSPKENGINISLKASEEEKEMVQTAYISLFCAYLGTNSKVENVIVTDNKITITNQHENTNITEAVISNDLSLFSQVIKDLFSQAE